MADRYWRGGSGTWSTTNTANWSTTNGGAGGASVPTSADNVFFTASSGTTYTVTIGAGVSCLNMSIASPPVGGVLTITSLTNNANGITCYGNWTSTRTRVQFGSNTLSLIAFYGTTDQSITTGGLVFTSYYVSFGLSSTPRYIINDNFTHYTTTGYTSLNFGYLDVSAGVIYSTRKLVSASNTADRGIYFGTSGQISLDGNNDTILDISSTIRWVYTGTSRIVCTYSGGTGTRTLNHTTSAAESQVMNYYIGYAFDTISWSGHAAKSMNFTGFLGTIAYPAANPIVYGNCILDPALTLASGSGRSITFKTSDANTVYQLASSDLSWPYTVNFSGGSWTLADNLTVNNQLGILSNLNLNNKTVSCDSLNMSSSNTRVLAFGNTSSINVTGSNQAVIGFATATGFSFTGTPNLFLSYSGGTGTRFINSGNTAGGTETTALPPLKIIAGTDTVSTNGVFKALDYRGFSGNATHNSTMYVYGNYIQSPTMTNLETTIQLQFTGVTAGNYVIDTAGVNIACPTQFLNTFANYTVANNITWYASNASIITPTSPILFNGGNIDFSDKILRMPYAGSSSNERRTFTFGNTGGMDIYGTALTGATSAVIFSFTSVGNISWAGNSNIQFTHSGSNSAISRWIRFAATAAANSVPNIIIAQGVDTIDLQGAFGNIAWGNWTGNFAHSAALNLYRDFILNANCNGVTPTNQAMTFKGDLDQKFDTGGKPFDCSMLIDKPVSGTVSLVRDMVLSNNRAFTVTSGNFNANNKNITAGSFTSTGIPARTVTMGNGVWTLQSNASVWNTSLASNLTLNYDRSTVVINSASRPNMNPGTAPMGNVVISPKVDGAGAYFQSNSSYNSISSNTSFSYWANFQAGMTFSVNNFSLSGYDSSRLAFIQSTSATPFNLVYTGNGTVNINNASIAASNATPATGTWYALLTNNNVDSGNNAGWIFALSDVSSNFFLVF